MHLRLIIPALLIVLGPVAAGQETKRRPLPGREAVGKAEALVRDVFGEDLDAAKEPEAKSKLAAVFLQQGRDSKDEPANRYVLLIQARDLAASAGDFNLAILAIDELGKEFAVPVLELKAKALTAAAGAATQENSKALVEATLTLIGEALEADDYDAAVQLGQAAQTAAKRSKLLPLVSAVEKRNEEILAVQKSFARLKGFIDRLEKNSDDAEANLELGRYFGLFKGRWERALPLLARGGDAELREQAKRDLAKPEDPHKQLDVADGWWELASKAKDPAQLNLQKRALYWYEQTIGRLAGLNRTKALRRIDIVAARVAGQPSESGPVGPVGELRKLEGHTDEVRAVAFSPEGRFAASGGLDRVVRVWDLATGKEVKALPGHTKQIWDVAFHPSGRQVFSTSWDTSLRLWDVASGSEVRRFNHPIDVNGIAVSRDGSQLLTGCDDHHVRLWDTASGDELRKFTGHSNFAYGVAFAPDGRHAASAGVDRTARVFELATGQPVRTFDGHQNAVLHLVFSPDSRYLFTCGDNVAHQWEITTGKEARRFEGHTGLVLSVALSPDGKRLLTGGDDKTVRLWDVATGKELHRFNGHTDNVNSVAFSPDGHRALSGSLDRTVRLWGLPVR